MSNVQLNLNENDTISKIKHLLYQHTNIPIHKQKIFHCNKLLSDDNKTLLDYGINHRVTMNVDISLSNITNKFNIQISLSKVIPQSQITFNTNSILPLIKNNPIFLKIISSRISKNKTTAILNTLSSCLSGDRKQTFHEKLLKNDIMTKLDPLLHPCTECDILVHVIDIYTQLCLYKNVLKYNHGIEFSSNTDRNWMILKHLMILLFYENDNIIINTLFAIESLIYNAAGNADDVKAIICNGFENNIKSIYEPKKHQLQLLFGGYMAMNERLDIVIPTDVVWLIWCYFNVYTNTEYDLVTRILQLFNRNNTEITIPVISIIQAFTAYCDKETAFVLAHKYNIVNYARKILKLPQVMITNSTFWVIANLTYDLQEVTRSDLMELMVQKFGDMVENCIDDKVVINKNIISPLTVSLCRIVDNWKMKILISEHKLMDYIMIYLKRISKLSNESCNNMMDILAALIQVIELLLEIDLCRDICCESVKKYDGVSLLRQLGNNKVVFDVTEEISLRAMNVIFEYFPDNDDVDSII